MVLFIVRRSYSAIGLSVVGKDRNNSAIFENIISKGYSLERVQGSPWKTTLFCFLYVFLRVCRCAKVGWKEAEKFSSREETRKVNVRPLHLIAFAGENESSGGFRVFLAFFAFHPAWNRDDDRYPRDSSNFSLRASLLTLFPSFMGLFLK